MSVVLQNGAWSLKQGGHQSDEWCSGRLACVEDVVQEDRQVTVCEVANITNISTGSTHHIIHDVLQCCTVSSWWVPHHLTAKNKAMRMGFTLTHQQWYSQEGPVFLSRIISGNETCASLDPRIKGNIHGTEEHHITNQEKIQEAEVWREGAANSILGWTGPVSYGVLRARGYCEYQTLLWHTEASEGGHSTETARFAEAWPASPPQQYPAPYCKHHQTPVAEAVWLGASSAHSLQPRSGTEWLPPVWAPTETPRQQAQGGKNWSTYIIQVFKPGFLQCRDKDACAPLGQVSQPRWWLCGKMTFCQ